MAVIDNGSIYEHGLKEDSAVSGCNQVAASSEKSESDKILVNYESLLVVHCQRQQEDQAAPFDLVLLCKVIVGLVSSSSWNKWNIDFYFWHFLYYN